MAGGLRAGEAACDAGTLEGCCWVMKHQRPRREGLEAFPEAKPTGAGDRGRRGGGCVWITAGAAGAWQGRLPTAGDAGSRGVSGAWRERAESRGPEPPELTSIVCPWLSWGAEVGRGGRDPRSGWLETGGSKLLQQQRNNMILKPGEPHTGYTFKRLGSF